MGKRFERYVSRPLAAAVLLAWACSGSRSAPEAQVQPVGTLGPGPVSSATQSAFAVVYAGPRGAAPLASAINLLFNRSLRSAESAVATPPPPILLEPRVEGQWSFVGARALTFVPRAGRLPAATAFRVQVPAETHALDGQALGTAYELSFETAAPAVLGATPESGATGQEPDVPIVLTFNQRVSASELLRVGRLELLGGPRPRAVPFDVRGRPDAPNVLEVVPRRPLPLASSLQFRIPAGLKGIEGPRPLEAEHTLRFDTYGPLAVVGVNCSVSPELGGCDPDGSLWVELSNPVKPGDFRSHLGIEPALPLLWSDEDEQQESRYFYLPLAGSLAAETAYRVTLTPGLVDQHGQRLSRKEERVLSTGNFAPRVRLPIEGEIFPAPLEELDLQVRNASDLRIMSSRLDGEKLLDYFALRDDYERRSELPAKLGAQELLVPGSVDNLVHVQPIRLGPILGAARPRGASYIGWRFGKVSESQLVQVTDLGLTAKLSTQGSLVWVTRLSDGLPVAGATVELLGRNPKLARSYRTDAGGIASIPTADYSPRLEEYRTDDDTLIFARLGDDSSFRRVADFLPPWRLDPPLRLSVPEREYGLSFSERGIYRPGDTVKVKGIVRRESSTGNALIQARKLELRLEDPFGEVAEKLSVETTRFGTFAADVHVPGSASLGGWRVLVEGFDDAALGVEVAEYRPAEFKVKADAALPAYLAADTARFKVQADYLFGSPMAGAKVSYTVTRQQASFAPPSSSGYVTSDDAYRMDLDTEPLAAAVLARGEGNLSPAGGFDVALPLALPGQLGPEQVRLDAEVSDLSRQALAASTGTLVHPASHYLGLAELDSWFQTVPSTIQPRVVALSKEGEHLGERKVKLELIRRHWTIAREKTSDGWRTRSVPVDETASRCELVTSQQPQSCALALVESGQYVVRATSPDPAGRVARASLGFYAIGAGRASWADNDQRKLELVLDKKQYRVGDTARVLIKSPFERAEALLTVERAGLYEHRRLTLTGPTPTVEIKIDERLRPNAYVAVHLVQAVVGNAPATAPEVTPESGYRIGYANLIVDPEARRLGVALTGLAKDYRPGQTLKLDVNVTRVGGAGHPAEVTVYAVDEGVLSLTGYAAPDPLLIFTAPRPLGVATLESRDALGRLLLLGPERDKGMAGGGGGALGVRSNFRTTAYFDPNVVTDATGKAHVEFALPDTLTTYRVMAVAVSEDDRYGVGNAAITVNQPLMIRPALPRMLRAGDRFEAAAIVTSRQFDAGTVKVSAVVSGATVLGAAEREVQIGRDGSGEVRFTVDVTAPGEARFAFAAVAAAERDRVEVTRQVSSPAALEATAVYGQTEASEAQGLGDLSTLRRDVGGLEIELASTALVGLNAGLSQLIEYPYACTEQLSSRLLPYGPLVELARRYGIALPADLAATVEARVGEILKRQRGDGGFGLWPDSPETHPWASAYALWVLWQAKAAGAQVPERVFEQGVSYLRQALGTAQQTRPGLVTAALMLDVLATLGQPDAQYVSQLFERRAELPDFSKALLLHAAQLGKGDASIVTTLTHDLENLISLHGNKAQIQSQGREAFPELFDSEARSEALALWALLAVNPEHPLALPLAQGVLGRRAAGRWRSTQESAYALLGLDAYRRAREKDSPRFEAHVWLGQRSLSSGAFDGPSTSARLVRLPMAELGQSAAPLVFEKQGTGTLFYEARLRYAPQALPTEPLEVGFGVRKGLHAVRPETLADALARAPDTSLAQADFAGGDLVLIDLVVAAPSLRHFVVIEDPLPAGFEAVDASLATTSSSLDIAFNPAGPDASATGFQSSWYRRELRDDRVLFFADELPAGLYHYRYLARATALGRFVVPPTRVEEMYQPEVFGRTAASHVEIH